MPNIVELVASRKEHFLHVDGYLYYKHSDPKNVYWRCRNYEECSARVTTKPITDPSNIIIVKGGKESDHKHAPNREEVEAAKIVGGIKRAAEDQPDMPSASLLRHKLRKVPSEVLVEMPDRPNLIKQISRTRLRNMQPNPTRVADLEAIPAQYKQTLSGSNFLLYDSFDDEEDEECDHGRILVFSTAENLRLLFRCDVWFVDGTFKTAPSIFFQFFAILGATNQVGVNRKPQTVGLPFVYALLENKRQSGYVKIFQEVLRAGRQLGLDSTPRLIMSDFEMGIINATKEIFGEGRVKCCFFHLCQNVYKRVKDEGLSTLYNSDDRTIKKGIHMLCALAFVPTDKVITYFRIVRDNLPEELDAVADYFEINYIRRLKIKRRQGKTLFKNHPARYDPDLWNHFLSVLDGTARTNNLSEGWHNRFQLVIGKHHPSLYAFFTELQKEQGDTEIMIRQLQLGQRIRKGMANKRRQYEEKLLTVVQSYQEYVANDDIMSYLRTVGYRIKF